MSKTYSTAEEIGNYDFYVVCVSAGFRFCRIFSLYEDMHSTYLLYNMLAAIRIRPPIYVLDKNLGYLNVTPLKI